MGFSEAEKERVRAAYERDGFAIFRGVLDGALVREAGAHMPFRGCEAWR